MVFEGVQDSRKSCPASLTEQTPIPGPTAPIYQAEALTPTPRRQESDAVFGLRAKAKAGQSLWRVFPLRHLHSAVSWFNAAKLKSQWERSD